MFDVGVNVVVRQLSYNIVMMLAAKDVISYLASRAIGRDLM